MSTRINEQNLVRLLQEGDSHAFAQVYQRYAPRLTNFASSKLASLEEARDVIHDVFVYLWEQRTTIVLTKGLEPFLFTAIRNRIIDHIRKNSTREEYALKLQQLSVHCYGPDSFLEAKDIQQVISNAVADMPKRVREIYRLSREEHLSVAEIAEKLQLSEQTVRNQLHTALNLLRRSVAVQSLPILWLLDWLLS